MYAPLWMEGAERRCLVSPEEIAKLGSRGDDGGVASPHETATANGKFVDVARKRTAADGDGWWPLLGCHTREKNVCRTHGAISAHMANQLDGLVALFNAWMMSIGKQSANTVDHFALLHSGDGRHKRIVMLSDCVWSPRCQIFTRCHLPTVDRDTFSVMPAFPFRFTIGASRGSCRLGGQGFCLWNATSDELAMQLLRDAPAWDVIPLVVVPDTESRSLRDCIATGHMDKVLLRTAERARAHTARDALRDAEHAVIKLDASCPDAASAAASAMPPGILAGACQRELVCPRIFDEDEDGLGDLRGDVSGTCTPLVESDLGLCSTIARLPLARRQKMSCLPRPLKAMGLVQLGAPRRPPTYRRWRQLARPRPAPRPKTLFSRASKTGEAS